MKVNNQAYDVIFNSMIKVFLKLIIKVFFTKYDMTSLNQPCLKLSMHEEVLSVQSQLSLQPCLKLKRLMLMQLAIIACYDHSVLHHDPLACIPADCFLQTIWYQQEPVVTNVKLPFSLRTKTKVKCSAVSYWLSGFAWI